MDESTDYARFGYVIASKRITEDEARVGFMYRQPPDEGGDSGWRFFAGDEDDIFAAKPENYTVNSITSILAIDPSIEKYISSPVNSVFERVGPENEFVVVTDFSP